MVKECQHCGAKFETATGRAKYCAQCREELRAEIARKSHGDRAGNVHNCDSDERISICLSCTVPAKRCNGYCEKIRLAAPKYERAAR